MNKKEQKKTKNQISNKIGNIEQLDINGNPIDPKKKYLGKKIKVPFLSADSSFYKNHSTIILFGGKRPLKQEQSPKSKFEEFLGRAPISFDKEEDI